MSFLLGELGSTLFSSGLNAAKQASSGNKIGSTILGLVTDPIGTLMNAGKRRVIYDEAPPPDYDSFYKESATIVGVGFLAIVIIGFVTSKSTPK